MGHNWLKTLVEIHCHMSYKIIYIVSHKSDLFKLNVDNWETIIFIHRFKKT